MTENQIAVQPQQTSTLSVFASEQNFQNSMKMAEYLSKSDMIPATYKNKPENCIIALELSNRLKLSPFLVMQNMYIVQGKPAWSSSFIISCINGSGRFTGPLTFEMDEAKTKCRAVAVDKATGKKLVSPLITMEMAKAEGWLTKNGSKWKTMPELMLRYRAAAFFGRLYCPEIINGMMTEDEAQDIKPITQDDVIDPFETTPIPTVEEEPEETKEIEITQEMEEAANAYFEQQELLQQESK